MEDNYMKDLLDKRLKEGKSIANYATGYYISAGHPEHSPTLHVAIFGTRKRDTPLPQVLVDFLGEMFWINIKEQHIVSGGGYGIDTMKEGQLLRYKLEQIKAN